MFFTFLTFLGRIWWFWENLYEKPKFTRRRRWFWVGVKMNYGQLYRGIASTIPIYFGHCPTVTVSWGSSTYLIQSNNLRAALFDLGIHYLQRIPSKQDLAPLHDFIWNGPQIYALSCQLISRLYHNPFSFPHFSVRYGIGAGWRNTKSIHCNSTSLFDGIYLRFPFLEHIQTQRNRRIS
ncbi:hypothetical protein BYT27DRAFT_7254508 [Phlegmacium glaucopus]|nr:hypothetical protein BYT27DRAFT_7254508 [Phlegmacium glaucopus]